MPTCTKVNRPYGTNRKSGLRFLSFKNVRPSPLRLFILKTVTPTVFRLEPRNIASLSVPDDAYETLCSRLSPVYAQQSSLDTLAKPCARTPTSPPTPAIPGAQPAIGAEGGRESMPCPCPTCTPGKSIGPASALSCPRQCRLQVEQGGGGSRHQLKLLWENATSRHTDFSPAPRGNPQPPPHMPTLPSRHPAPSRGTQLPAQPSSPAHFFCWPQGRTVVAAAQLRTLAGPHSRARWFFLSAWLSL